MSLSLHTDLTPLQIFSILVITAKTLLESNPRVESDGAHRVGEAAVADHAVGVATRAIDLVPDRLCLVVCRGESFAGIGRFVDSRQEGTWALLSTRIVHCVETAVILIDVRVTTPTVNMVA